MIRASNQGRKKKGKRFSGIRVRSSEQTYGGYYVLYALVVGRYFLTGLTSRLSTYSEKDEDEEEKEGGEERKRERCNEREEEELE